MRDFTNQRFGRLTARWPAGIRGQHIVWLCSCRCGRLKLVLAQSLSRGSTRSCGCLARETVIARNRKGLWIRHGHSRVGRKSSEHATWGAMIQRCTNPKHPKWKDYGGRGIKVCKRWRKFENFLADMGLRPSPELSLDRKNNNKGYYKSNCRWATAKEQQANTRAGRDSLGRYTKAIQ